MKRFIPLASALALISLPATALAAPTHGLVLSVSPAHHRIQLIDSRRAVHGYRYGGALPALHTGSRIHFKRTGRRIRNVVVVGRTARTIRFLGIVVRSGTSRLVIRLGDGGTATLAPRSLMHSVVRSNRTHPGRVQAIAATASTSFAPGAAVLVTEKLSARGRIVKVVVTPVGGPAGGGTGGTGGTGGSGGSSGSGGSGCSAATTSTDVIGSVTSASTSAITISTASQGAMTFALDDPTLTDGFVTGDQVDVSYAQQADCTMMASDVEYVESDALGTVAAVTSSSLTLIDQSTGQPETFTSDPSQGMFDGVAPGDQVDVTYHLNNGHSVVDAVN
jgi:hypothetical protein